MQCRIYKLLFMVVVISFFHAQAMKEQKEEVADYYHYMLALKLSPTDPKAVSSPTHKRFKKTESVINEHRYNCLLLSSIQVSRSIDNLTVQDADNFLSELRVVVNQHDSLWKERMLHSDRGVNLSGIEKSLSKLTERFVKDASIQKKIHEVSTKIDHIKTVIADEKSKESKELIVQPADQKGEESFLSVTSKKTSELVLRPQEEPSDFESSALSLVQRDKEIQEASTQIDHIKTIVADEKSKESKELIVQSADQKREAAFLSLTNKKTSEFVLRLQEEPSIFEPSALSLAQRNMVAELYLKGFKPAKKKNKKKVSLPANEIKALEYASDNPEGLFIKSKAAWKKNDFASSFDYLASIPLKEADALFRKKVLLAKAAMLFTGQGVVKDELEAQKILSEIEHLDGCLAETMHPVVLSNHIYSSLKKIVIDRVKTETTTAITSEQITSLRVLGRSLQWIYNFRSKADKEKDKGEVSKALERLNYQQALMGDIDQLWSFLDNDEYKKIHGYFLFHLVRNKKVSAKKLEKAANKALSLAKTGSFFGQLSYLCILHRTGTKSPTNIAEKLASIKFQNFGLNFSEVHFDIQIAEVVDFFKSETFKTLLTVNNNHVRALLGFLCAQHLDFLDDILIENITGNLSHCKGEIEKICYGILLYRHSLNIYQRLISDVSMSIEEKEKLHSKIYSNLLDAAVVGNLDARITLARFFFIDKDDRLSIDLIKRGIIKRPSTKIDMNKGRVTSEELGDWAYSLIKEIIKSPSFGDDVYTLIPVLFHEFLKRSTQKPEVIRDSAIALLSKSSLDPDLRKQLEKLRDDRQDLIDEINKPGMVVRKSHFFLENAILSQASEFAQNEQWDELCEHLKQYEFNFKNKIIMKDASGAFFENGTFAGLFTHLYLKVLQSSDEYCKKAEKNPKTTETFERLIALLNGYCQNAIKPYCNFGVYELKTLIRRVKFNPKLG